MAQKSIEITSFYGGSSENQKLGREFSNRFARNLNIFEDLNYATINPGTTKVSGSTVDGLVYWMVDGSPWDTNRYFYASNGDIYQETSAGVWSLARAVSGGDGSGLLAFDDFLYYPRGTNLGRYGKLSSSPAFVDAFSSWWLAADLQTTGGGTGSADYVPPTAISEAATARQTIAPDHDPLVSIVIDVDVVGSGDWTVTVHDAANNSLGSKTIVNGSMSTGDVTFTFATVIRVLPGETYHFHVTSTVADGGVDTNAATDLEGAEFTLNSNPLIAATFHPAINHLNLAIFGSERYLAVWNQAEYNPNKVVFEAGFEVRTLAKDGEFVVAGCIRGTDVEGVEEGRIYWWDGIAPTFNDYKDVPGGVVNALHTDSRDRLFGILGNRGALYFVGDSFTKIQDVPNLARGKKLEVYPGGMTEWLGKTLIGYGTTDDASFPQGIYEFGNQKEGLPEVLNMGYTISTGAYKDTDIKVGSVKAFGKDLYIGWLGADGTTYGVDKVVKTDNPFTAASWESLVHDDGRPSKPKLAYNVIITFEALVSGQSVKPKYRVEKASSFTDGTTVDTVGATQAELHLNKRYWEIEFGFDLVTSGSDFPKVLSVQFYYNDLLEERGEQA